MVPIDSRARRKKESLWKIDREILLQYLDFVVLVLHPAIPDRLEYLFEKFNRITSPSKSISLQYVFAIQQ